MTPRKNLVGVMVRATISGLLIWYIFSRVDFIAVTERLALIAPTGAAIAIGLLLLQLPVVTDRWCRVIAAIAVPLPFTAAIRLVMIGLFFNQTLPSAIGGDVVRIWKAHKLGLTLGKATNSVLLDRLCALAATCLLVAVFSPWLLALFPQTAFRAVLCGLLAATCVGFILLTTLDLIPGPPAHWRLTRTVHALSVDARRVFGHPATVFPTLCLSVIVVLTTGVTVYALALALAIPLELQHAIVLMPLVLLTTMIPVSIAGWGVRELSMVTVLGAVDVPADGALAVSLAFGLAILLVGLAGGVLWLRDHRPADDRPTQETRDTQGPPA